MNPKDSNFKKELIQALSVQLNHIITDVKFESVPLHGGTLGTVMLVTGTAITSDGHEFPYSIVHKTQKQWCRHFDENSWRREYDLYSSDLDQLFSPSFRWPTCYHSKLEEDIIELWMEYIEGNSGSDLTIDMFELAAKELGRFQGRLFAQTPAQLKSLPNLNTIEYVKSNYYHYRSWNEVYDYIRDENCSLPKHLCEMLWEIDEKANEIWLQIESLPVVFCHRDFWITNIFYSNGHVLLIDWDTSGWGYLGEDIASLIADEADITQMVAYYKRCVPAYYQGFSEYADVSTISNPLIIEMMLLRFGYRLVEGYKFGETEAEKQLKQDTLQKIYDMKSLTF